MSDDILISAADDDWKPPSWQEIAAWHGLKAAHYVKVMRNRVMAEQHAEIAAHFGMKARPDLRMEG